MHKSSHKKLEFEQCLLNAERVVSDNFIICNNVDNLPQPFSFERPFVFDGLILGLCVRGELELSINYKEYDVTCNTILMLYPDHIYDFSGRSDDFLLKLVFVSNSYIHQMLGFKDFEAIDNILQQPCLKISEEDMNSVLEIYDYIDYSYYNSKNLYLDDLISTLLYACFTEIRGIYKKYGQKRGNIPEVKNDRLIQDFFKLLKLHYKEKRSVTFYADQLCLTSKHLSSTIRSFTGRSVHSWINEIIITEAMSSLKRSDFSVLQISEELNFANPAFFTKFFKQHTGMTPTEYRNT